jgi:hypothetical protein
MEDKELQALQQYKIRNHFENLGRELEKLVMFSLEQTAEYTGYSEYKLQDFFVGQGLTPEIYVDLKIKLTSDDYVRPDRFRVCGYKPKLITTDTEYLITKDTFNSLESMIFWDGVFSLYDQVDVEVVSEKEIKTYVYTSEFIYKCMSQSPLFLSDEFQAYQESKSFMKKY